MAISGLEEIAPPTIKYNANSVAATRVFRLPDQDLLGDFLRVTLGQFNVSDGETVPGTLGQFPGIGRLFVSDIDVQSFDADNVGAVDQYGVATHQSGLRIVVSYATRQWDAPPGASLDPGQNTQPPYSDSPGGTGSGAKKRADGKSSNPAEAKKILATHQIEFGGQIREVPNSAMQWEESHPISGSQVVQDGVRAGAFEGHINHTITWYRVNKPPWAKIRRAMGRVNADEFIGYAPETTLFLGLSASRQWGVEGDRHWQLTYKFVTRDQWYLRENNTAQVVTWNHFYRHSFDEWFSSSSSPWQKLEEKGRPGRYVYQTANFFDTLFTQSQTDDYNVNESLEA